MPCVSGSIPAQVVCRNVFLHVYIVVCIAVKCVLVVASLQVIVEGEYQSRERPQESRQFFAVN